MYFHCYKFNITKEFHKYMLSEMEEDATQSQREKNITVKTRSSIL